MADRRAYQREWYANNREHSLECKRKWKQNNPDYNLQQAKNSADRRRARRLQAIEALGGKCLVCGFDDERALQFDHIIPVRRREAGTRNHGGCLQSFEFKAIIEGEEHQIQLLCANCHAIKTSQDRANNWHKEKE